jgi:large repetitive protein
MMTVSLRVAHPSQPRISLAAVRSGIARSGIARSGLLCFSLLLMLFALFGGQAFAQGLSPGNPISFGPVDLLQKVTQSQNFSVPVTGADILSVTVVTQGVTGKDFTLVPGNTCTGNLPFPTSCSVTVAFTPQQIGLRLGALIIANTSGTVVNLITLSGVGLGPQFAFQPDTATTLDTATGLTPANFTAGAAVQDPNGDTFFTDVANNRILEETSTGLFSLVFAGTPLAITTTSGLVLDGAGNLYVSSGTSVFVLALEATPPITPTVLPITGVTLTQPAGLALDTAGDLYIADTSANAVYQDVLGGATARALPFTGPGMVLAGPTGIAIADNNTLYIADSGNNRIVEAPITTSVTTVLALNTLTLHNPTGVTVDPAGTVYIADTGNARIVEATATTASDQFVLTATPPLVLEKPATIVVEATGDLLVSDTNLGLITIVRTTALVNFPTPTEVGTLDATDDPETLTVQETGNLPSTLNATTDPSLSGTNPTAFLLPNTGTCPSLNGGAPTAADTFAIGQICTYNVNFQPTVVGPNTANLVLSTTAVGGATTTGTISLFGIGLNQLNHFTLVASTTPTTTPTTVDLGGTVELTLTAIQADGAIATDYTGTITFTTSDPNGKYLSGTGAGTNTVTFIMTAADDGVLMIPMAAGLQLNDLGVFTATATADPNSVPPGAIGVAVSNDIFVIEPATLTLTSSVNPSLVNQQTIFTLTVTTTGTATPTGSVSFFNNGVLIGVVNLSGTGTTATASIPDSFPAAGAFPISATYTSTSSTQGGTANLTQLVGNVTGLTLTSSVNPSLVGQSTNLTATIASLAAFGPTTGSIQFFDGTTSLGTVPVTGSSATLPVSFSTAGTHNLTAVYTTTNAELTNATSNVVHQLVLNVAALALTSSVNPSLPGQQTILTATLTALGTPTGTIKFFDGTTLLGTVNLTGLTATLPVSFTVTGNHILTAVYSGDALTETVTSPPLTQVVLFATTATLTSSVNPVDVNANTTLTATIKSTTGTPTGTVLFKSNGVAIGTGTLNGGVATLVTSFPLPGTYTLIAVYSGDANNQTSTTNTVLETVLNVVNISLTSSVNPVFLDNPTILTAAIVPVAAGTTPTGTVTFFDGTTPIGTGTIATGTVSITAAFVFAGTHTITAVYSGDAADATGTSPALLQTVADFSLTVASGSSSTGTIIAGGNTAFPLVVTPIITSTLPGAITLTVTGLPSTVTGTLTPATIAAGSAATDVSLSVTAASLLATAQLNKPNLKPTPPHRSALGYAPLTLALLGLPLAWSRRRKRFGALLASLCLLVMMTAGLTGCISSPATGYYGQTPQTYNLTVTATSGNLSRSTYLTLTVQ